MHARLTARKLVATGSAGLVTSKESHATGKLNASKIAVTDYR